MISRDDIADEAAFIHNLINPTGLEHTPTPWHKGPDADPTEPLDKQFVDAAVLGSFVKWAAANPLFSVLDTKGGTPLALFKHKADRDLAHYFVSHHAAIISMIRQLAGAFEFLARASPDAGAKHFAATQAENAHAYADLFSRLGRTQ